MRSKSRSNRSRNQLRIIAGEWRGRRIEFPDSLGLRPTGDRIRETVFNWLAPIIDGACCLDVFAGSGALGIEALSRGAAHCQFLEQDAVVSKSLRTQLELLGADNAKVATADSLAWLNTHPAEPFDLVFLDPPFASELLQPCFTALQAGWLKPGSRVYYECATRNEIGLPTGWTPLRSKQSGQVGYHLAKVETL